MRSHSHFRTVHIHNNMQLRCCGQPALAGIRPISRAVARSHGPRTAIRAAHQDAIATQEEQQQRSAAPVPPPDPHPTAAAAAAEERATGPAVVAAATPQDARTAAAAAAAAAAADQAAAEPWQQRMSHQFEGLLTGPCLIAAGALACSFISLQVKLFDHHVPPLFVTACSSAVAWLATSAFLGQQQWAELHPNQQPPLPQPPLPLPQQQQQPQAGSQLPPPAAAAAAGAAASGTDASKPRRLVDTPSISSLLLLRGLLGAATVTAYYAAVEELPLSVAVALFFFHPMLALFLDAAVLGHRVSTAAAGSCALTVLGVLVIGWHNQLLLHLEQAAVFVEACLGGEGGLSGAAAAAAAAGQDVLLGPELSLHGVLMGLVAAGANAAAFVVVGLIGTEVSPLNVCWWQYCVTTHAAVAVLLLTELESAVAQASAAVASSSGGVLDLTISSSSSSGGSGAAADGLLAHSSSIAAGATGVLGGLGGLGLEELQQLAQGSLLQLQDALPNQHDTLLLSGVVVANFAGQLLLNAGFQRIDAGRGAAVNTLQVLFANVWDVLLLHSQPSGGILVGLGMITAGVFGTRRSAVGEEQQQQQQQRVG